MQLCSNDEETVIIYSKGKLASANILLRENKFHLKNAYK